MDKAFLAKQLDVVKNAPPGEAVAFTVEAAGVLRAFVDARRKKSDISPAEQALHTKIERLLSVWEKSTPTAASSESGPGKEQRTQLVLRAAIDKVLNDQFATITDGEIKLLQATHEVFSKRCENDEGANPRLVGMLRSTLDTLDANRDKLKGIKDESLFDSMPTSEPPVDNDTIIHNLMADEAFGNIQRTSLTTVEDVQMELNVRVFEFEGNTAISGDVPNDVLVRVKAGNLGVSGFVAGYVVADKNIRIDGNIQGGAAISNKGSITVDRSLMGAALIAKQGGIVCNHVESPKCVFAWNSLVVEGPCMDGTITAGSMRIKGKVAAAKLVSCGAIECKSLSVSSRSETIVYLADHIECTAYQRPLEDTLDNQFNDIGGWKKKIESYEEADKFTLNLIYNTYRTALFFYSEASRARRAPQTFKVNNCGNYTWGNSSAWRRPLRNFTARYMRTAKRWTRIRFTILMRT